jgi:hypothetical protein
MKSTSLLTMSLLGALILACSGLDSTDEPPATPPVTGPEEAPAAVSAPWAAMGLPWSGGELLASDPTMLLVAWEGQSVSSIASSYDTAMSASGFSGMGLISEAELVVSSYSRADTNIGMMVITEEGLTYAYLEDVSTVEESAVESARAGKRPPGISGRKGTKAGKRGKGGKGGKSKSH